MYLEFWAFLTQFFHGSLGQIHLREIQLLKITAVHSYTYTSYIQYLKQEMNTSTAIYYSAKCSDEQGKFYNAICILRRRIHTFLTCDSGTLWLTQFTAITHLLVTFLPTKAWVLYIYTVLVTLHNSARTPSRCRVTRIESTSTFAAGRDTARCDGAMRYIVNLALYVHISLNHCLKG